VDLFRFIYTPVVTITNIRVPPEFALLTQVFTCHCWRSTKCNVSELLRFIIYSKHNSMSV